MHHKSIPFRCSPSLTYSSCKVYAYAVLAPFSRCCPPDRGRLLMYYSPVRHWHPKMSVRLACIRHAASVHPEPGSNSPLSYFKFFVDSFLAGCFFILVQSSSFSYWRLGNQFSMFSLAASRWLLVYIIIQFLDCQQLNANFLKKYYIFSNVYIFFHLAPKKAII